MYLCCKAGGVYACCGGAEKGVSNVAEYGLCIHMDRYTQTQVAANSDQRKPERSAQRVCLRPPRRFVYLTSSSLSLSHSLSLFLSLSLSLSLSLRVCVCGHLSTHWEA